MVALPNSHSQTPSASNETVSCEHADRCGGCPLIGLPYSEQLAIKLRRVEAAMTRYRSLEHTPTEAVAPAGTIVAYRTRAKLMAAHGHRLGLFAKGGGHEVVDIPGCRVLAPVLQRVATALRERIVADESSCGPLAPHDGSGRGSLRAVDLREVCDGDATRAL